MVSKYCSYNKGKVQLCVDFRDLIASTIKDMYVMLLRLCYLILLLIMNCCPLWMDFLVTNKILIVVEDIPEITFRCPGSIGTFE